MSQLQFSLPDIYILLSRQGNCLKYYKVWLRLYGDETFGFDIFIHFSDTFIQSDVQTVHTEYTAEDQGSEMCSYDTFDCQNQGQATLQSNHISATRHGEHFFFSLVQ